MMLYVISLVELLIVITLHQWSFRKSRKVDSAVSTDFTGEGVSEASGLPVVKARVNIKCVDNTCYVFLFITKVNLFDASFSHEGRIANV